jgi:hypothetical protein
MLFAKTALHLLVLSDGEYRLLFLRSTCETSRQCDRVSQRLICLINVTIIFARLLGVVEKGYHYVVSLPDYLTVCCGNLPLPAQSIFSFHWGLGKWEVAQFSRCALCFVLL